MNSTTDFGSTLAASAALPTTTIATSLADLLLLINRKDGTLEGMLHAVAARFLEYVGLTAERASIEMMNDAKAPFFAHMKAEPYKASSVRSYRNYFNILLRRASEAGWVCPEYVLPSEWQGIADVLPQSSTKLIVRFAVRIGKTPRTLCEDDLAVWRQERVKEGHSLEEAAADCSRFRTATARAGFSAKLPLIKPQDKRYGVPIDDMHPDLRQEVKETLQ